MSTHSSKRLITANEIAISNEMITAVLDFIGVKFDLLPVRETSIAFG